MLRPDTPGEDGSCDWQDEYYSEDAENERWTCIGKGCLCPHVPHMRAECFTLEMAEAWEKDGGS